MAHLVIFRTTDGKPAYHQTEALDDAVRFVEHLRNEEQVTDARIFTMSEVPIEFKVQWRVEVATPIVPPVTAVAESVSPADAADAREAADTADAIAAPEEAPSAADAPGSDSSDADEPVPVAVGGGESYDESPTSEAPTPSSVSSASSRFGLFSRG